MRASWHDLWIIVPMRGIGAGKTRLAGVLDPSARMRLNRRLLAHTLAVIGRAPVRRSRCIVTSSCARALAIARAHGATALTEPRPRAGLNRAITRAIDYARRRGARRFLVLPADLPRLSLDALRTLATPCWTNASMRIASDRASTGTNALLIASRARFAPQFGPDSFAKHSRLSARAITVCRIPELQLDLDTPQDLRTWLRARRASPKRYRMV